MRAQRLRRHDVEPGLEAGARREADGHAAHVRVGIGVRDEHERGGADPFDLELGVVAAATLGDDAEQRPREMDVRGATTVRGAPERVDPPDDLRGDPHSRVEGEAPPVDPPERVGGSGSRAPHWNRSPPPGYPAAAPAPAAGRSYRRRG